MERKGEIGEDIIVLFFLLLPTLFKLCFIVLDKSAGQCSLAFVEFCGKASQPQTAISLLNTATTAFDEAIVLF